MCFILMMHHIICDWASEGIIWRELSALYSSFLSGKPVVLPALPIDAWRLCGLAGTEASHGELWRRSGFLGGDAARRSGASRVTCGSTPSGKDVLSGRPTPLEAQQSD